VPSLPSRRKAHRRVQRGVTLIEVALVLSLTGVLLAAFVPTFLRHLRTSKIAEAVERLAALHGHAAAYYERPRAGTQGCLPTSAGPYPAVPSAEPVLVDFGSDPSGAATWLALGQRRPAPLRYSYEVLVPEPGCVARPSAAAAITLRAHGDLDGDGERSLLERSAAPSAPGASASDPARLLPRGPLRIIARTE